MVIIIIEDKMHIIPEGVFRNRGRKWSRYSGGGRNYVRSENRSENQQPLRKTNPEDREGRTSRCNICESKLHWARRCPHAYENLRIKDNNSNSGEPHFGFFVTILLMTLIPGNKIQK